MNYRPSPGSVKSRGKDDDVLLEEYRAQGLQDLHINSIQSIVRSQRIDYQVQQSFQIHHIAFSLHFLVNYGSRRPHHLHRNLARRDSHFSSWGQ